MASEKYQMNEGMVKKTVSEVEETFINSQRDHFIIYIGWCVYVLTFVHCCCCNFSHSQLYTAVSL